MSKLFHNFFSSIISGGQAAGPITESDDEAKGSPPYISHADLSFEDNEHIHRFSPPLQYSDDELRADDLARAARSLLDHPTPPNPEPPSARSPSDDEDKVHSEIGELHDVDISSDEDSSHQAAAVSEPESAAQYNTKRVYRNPHESLDYAPSQNTYGDSAAASASASQAEAAYETVSEPESAAQYHGQSGGYNRISDEDPNNTEAFHPNPHDSPELPDRLLNQNTYGDSAAAAASESSAAESKVDEKALEDGRKLQESLGKYIKFLGDTASKFQAAREAVEAEELELSMPTSYKPPSIETEEIELPIAALHKPSRTSKVFGRQLAAQKKGEAIITDIAGSLKEVERQLKQLDSFLPSEAEKKSPEAWSYLSVAAKASAISVVVMLASVTGTGLGAAAWVYGFSFPSAVGGITGVMSGITGVFLGGGGVAVVPATAAVTAGLAAGGLSASELMKSRGGIDVLIKEWEAVQSKLALKLEQQYKEGIEAISVLKTVAEEKKALANMLRVDQQKIADFLIDYKEGFVKRSKEWLEERAAAYSDIDDTATAILAYGMVNPRSLSLPGPMHSLDQAQSFGSILTVADWLYSDASKKVDFIYNVAVVVARFMAREQRQEFSPREYMEWMEIVEGAGHNKIIEFDLEASKRCELKDVVLTATVAAKKFQIERYKEKGKQIKDIINGDAIDILLSKSDFNFLLERYMKIYSEIFEVAEAKKHKVALVCSIIDPYSNIDVDEQVRQSLNCNIDPEEQVREILMAISRKHPDINIGKIVNYLQQDDLAYSVAEYIMRKSFCPRGLKDLKGHQEISACTDQDIESFSGHSVIIECAAAVKKKVLVFAHEVSERCGLSEGGAVANPLAAPEYHRIASPELAISPMALRDILHSPLEGEGGLEVALLARAGDEIKEP